MEVLLHLHLKYLKMLTNPSLQLVLMVAVETLTQGILPHLPDIPSLECMEVSSDQETKEILVTIDLMMITKKKKWTILLSSLAVQVQSRRSKIANATAVNLLCKFPTCSLICILSRRHHLITFRFIVFVDFCVIGIEAISILARVQI